MLPVARFGQCQVSPVDSGHVDHTRPASRVRVQPTSNSAALLDELFLVLYDPKEVLKLKLSPQHYSVQVPMRLRRLPKSFFVCPSSGVSVVSALGAVECAGSKCRPSHHFEYCCASKAVQSSAPSAPAVSTGPVLCAVDPSNQLVISNHNHQQHHISFIEGHHAQFDRGRMFASIEVTATTLKYQKTLQLPATAHSNPSNAFLTTNTFGGPTWDSVGPNHYSGPNAQSNGWQMNHHHHHPQQRPSPEPMTESSSGSETEPDTVEFDPKSGPSVAHSSHPMDYLDLDSFDSALEYSQSNAIENNSNQVSQADPYGPVYGVSEQPHCQSTALPCVTTKHVIAEYDNYGASPALSTVIDQHSSVANQHCDQSISLSHQSPYSAAHECGNNVANLWNPSVWS